MKLNQKWIQSGILAGACAATLVFTGCAGTPADPAVGMASSVTQASKNLESSKTAISASLTSLNQLVSQPAGDLRDQYKNYLDSVKDLEKISAKTDASVQSMLGKSELYFADWGNKINAINDPTLKQLSADRKQTAVANLADLKTSVDKARDAFKPLMSDFNDVGTYLANNLTTAGIEGMKPRLATAKLDAVSVRDALNGVALNLNKFSTTLAQPAPAK